MTDMPGSNMELSIIAPVYNEELIIRNSVLKLVQAMGSFPEKWELILVNDGSTDSTFDILSELAMDDGRIHILSYKKNKGRGYALRMGFNHCRGKYVVTTESDLTWGEDIIARLYKELVDTDADIVIASPYTKGGKLENVPFRRAFLSWLGNRILRTTVPSNITMLSGMTRGYKADVIRGLPLEEDRKEIHLEIVSKACILGCQFSEIPATLRWKPPQKGKQRRRSKFQVRKLVRSHLLFGFNEAPILFFGGLGGIILLIGLLLGLRLCYLYFIKDQIIGDRVVSIMTTIFLILAGLSAFLFCFLSYQIKGLREELLKLRHKMS